MSRLSPDNLPQHIRSYAYDRRAVTTGIVHFGIGNFHRAHQAVYCDDLLNAGAKQWGITGVSLRSSSMQKALKPQDFLYTLTTLGETTEHRIMGAIKDVLVAPKSSQAVIDAIAKNTTHVISSTITEKGYYLQSGKVDFQQAALLAELESLSKPTTIYGFLARGIIQRSRAENCLAKLTVMCCDNISNGGDHLRDGVVKLLERHDPQALNWAQKNVAFISSMVDRVCPATDNFLRDLVLKDTKRHDEWPVSTEPFSQWIIEDGFAGERPNFDHVGAIFVDDIAPFETMKLRYLNAAHTIVSTLGYLSGDRFVHESLLRPEIFDFTRQALYKTVLPNAAVPRGYDGAQYIEDVIKRFQNKNLPYANLQVGTDSSQKIQQRWFPTLDHALRQNRETAYFEFCLGAWAIFVQTALAAKVLNDVKLARLKTVPSEDFDQLILSYLKIAGAESFAFYRQKDLISAATQYARNIKSKGIIKALSEFMNTHTKRDS